MWSTMSEDILNGLGILSIHKPRLIDIDDVIT